MNKILEKNLKIFSKDISVENSKIVKENMWNNYGMTFIEYIFLDLFRKNNNHIEISGKENLKKKIGK